MREFSEQELVRRKKLETLIERGVEPFGNRFDVSNSSEEIIKMYDQKLKILILGYKTLGKGVEFKNENENKEEEKENLEKKADQEETSTSI